MGIVDKKYRRSIWENCGLIEFEGRANLGLGTKIACRGHLKIGKDVSFNANSDIICCKNVTIGDAALVAWECLIMDSDFHSVYLKGTTKKINSDRAVYIGSHVWIGCRSTILKGSYIPDNSIIAACSTVTKPMAEENVIYGSNVILKRGVEWRS